MIRPEILNFLQSVELFRGMSKKSLEKLFEHIREISIGNHEFIYHRGDTSKDIYVIRYGEVLVRLGINGDNLRYLGMGDVLSENSVLTGSPHSGTAQAVLDTTLYAIDGKAFIELVAEDKLLAGNLNQLLGHRLKDYLLNSKGRTFTRRLISHLPIDKLTHFKRDLRQVVAAGKKAYESEMIMVDASRFEKMSASEAISELASIRQRYPVVHLYFTQARQACLLATIVMQSDLIVMWEKTGDDTPEKKEAIAYWSHCIRNFQERTIHMIDQGSARHRQSYLGRKKIFIRKETLGRYLVSKTRGLALGGGGARAMAHIGMLKVLEEEEINIDYVSGASFGGVVGALYARGENVSSIIDTIQHFFGGVEKPFLDPTLPVVSFYRGKLIVKLLKEAFGNQNIEDLETPFVTSAVDLLTGKEHVFDKGPIWEALAASISLPGVFPPRYYNGMLLVDGGTLNNVPENLIRSRGANVIIAGNVSPLEDSEMIHIMGSQKAGGKFSIRGLLEDIRYPPILRIISRSTTLEGREIIRLRKEAMDCFVNMQLQDFSLFSFKKYIEIISRGELQFRPYLPQVKKLFFPPKERMADFNKLKEKEEGFDFFKVPMPDLTPELEPKNQKSREESKATKSEPAKKSSKAGESSSKTAAKVKSLDGSRKATKSESAKKSSKAGKASDKKVKNRGKKSKT